MNCCDRNLRRPIIKMDLVKIPLIQPNGAKINLSNNHGIYFWFSNNDELVYIGIATGVGGLKHRIVNQHLNSKYLEYRETKHTKKDTFQLKHAVERIAKDGKSIQKGIDKSAFRKAIGRAFKIKPGEETVKYIVKNMYLKVREIKNVEKLKVMEKKLIQKYRPCLNTNFLR